MKRIIIAFPALVLVVPLVAQENGNNKYCFQKGFRFELDFGLNTNKACGSNYPSFEFHIISGYQFTKYLYAAIGTGRHIYHTKNVVGSYDDNKNAIPVFADVRGGLFNRRVSPYVSIKGGYLIPYPTWDYCVYGGMAGLCDTQATSTYFNPCLGVQFNILNNFSVNLSIGFNINKLHIQESSACW
jgi:hypothetical protein